MQLVFWNLRPLNISAVIPGKLAIANATRNPENENTSGNPLSRV
jgi:hypothetical protein